MYVDLATTWRKQLLRLIVSEVYARAYIVGNTLVNFTWPPPFTFHECCTEAVPGQQHVVSIYPTSY